MLVHILSYIVVFILVCTLIIAFLSSLNMTKRKYDQLVSDGFKQNAVSNPEILREEDLSHLPAPVKKYLHYVGVVGKEKVFSYTVRMTGAFKMNEDQPFAPAEVEQTSYLNDLTRLFYMKIKFKGLNIAGLHHFGAEGATMKIKILDLFKVVDASGELMNKGETVTIFNDMLLLAPATLIDKRITWKPIDDYRVMGTLTNGKYSVSATIVFNEEHQFINFISEDRYMLVDNEYKNVTWETPIHEYRQIDGYNLPYKGSAVWKLQDRDFEYIQLAIEGVEYNKR